MIGYGELTLLVLVISLLTLVGFGMTVLALSLFSSGRRRRH
jgi:hypothetical protein